MNISFIAAILILLGLSACLSASEFAYTSMNARRMRRAAEAGDRASSLTMRIYEKFDDALSAILIANNLVSVAASSLATVLAIRLAGEPGASAASGIMTVLFLMFGDIAPKIFGKCNADTVARAVAYPIWAIMTAFRPLVRVSVFVLQKLAALFGAGESREPVITEEEFNAILETAEDEGVIDEERTDLVQSALEFDDLTVAQVLTPRIDMVAVDAEDSAEEVLRVIIKTQFSRLPVYEDTVDNIIGILNVNPFLREMDRKADIDLRELLTPPLIIHKTMKLDDAMKLLQKERTHIAVVADEYGGTMGIVTMEDLLEQLVGDIWDENDDIIEPCVEVDENEYECSGLMSLHDFFDEMDCDDRNIETEYTTLGGWAVEMLDSQPQAGKSFDYGNLHVTVEKMDGVRVDRLHVTATPEKEASALR